MMIKGTFIFSTIVVVISFLLGVTTSTTILNDVYAQTELGEPFLKETGKITGQKEIGPGNIQATYSANGTLKGNISVTNTGDFVSISRGDNQTTAQGQGTFTTLDGAETAQYNAIAVGNVTQEGKSVFVGASAYNTNSTGDLAFLNNILGIFKVEIDETGNFVGTEWQWK
jgi:hypothetical protein